MSGGWVTRRAGARGSGPAWVAACAWLAVACASGETLAPDASDAAVDVASEASSDAGDAGDAASDADLADFGDASDAPPLDALDDGSDGDVDDAPGGDPDALDGPDAIEPCESDRVLLSGSRFQRRGAPWTMLGVNYIAEIRYEEGEGYYVGPHHAYCADNICCLDRAACLAELRDDLANLAALGFTAIRLVGLAARPEGGLLVAPTLENLPPNDIREGPLLPLYSDSQVFADVAVVLDALGVVLEEAGAVDLAVMLLAGHRSVDDPAMVERYGYYLADVASAYAEDPTLFAIDLMNEPGYEAFESVPDKAEANAIVRSWYDAIRDVAPGIHVTMGLNDSDTVRGWDPAALPLDFVTYHPYPFGAFEGATRARYERDLVWFQQAGIPWALGETGFAVDDWGPESMQADFAEASATLARDCGALGYLWWTYQDLHWGALEHFGLLRWDEGVRPAAARLAAVDWGSPGTCPAPGEGFNPDGYPATWAVRGRLLDREGAPLANGRVIGWRCPDWSGSTFSTFSNADGTFELRSDTGLVAIDFSAPGHERSGFLYPSCEATDFGDLTLDRSNLDVATATPDRCP